MLKLTVEQRIGRVTRLANRRLRIRRVIRRCTCLGRMRQPSR
jgi:hypothetical protein